MNLELLCPSTALLRAVAPAKAKAIKLAPNPLKATKAIPEMMAGKRTAALSLKSKTSGRMIFLSLLLLASVNKSRNRKRSVKRNE